MNSIGQPVPELPVADVERAQQHYRDALGLRLDGFTQAKRLGQCHAVMWRYSSKAEAAFEPAVHWCSLRNRCVVQELKSLGANIVDPLGKSLGDYGSSP